VKDPKIAIAAIVEGQELNQSFGGGRYAAPMARYVLEAYFKKHPEYRDIQGMEPIANVSLP